MKEQMDAFDWVTLGTDITSGRSAGRIPSKRINFPVPPSKDAAHRALHALKGFILDCEKSVHSAATHRHAASDVIWLVDRVNAELDKLRKEWELDLPKVEDEDPGNVERLRIG